jgi:outer membrane protein OmpA-like peptidoglycan-associated protein
LNVKRYFLIALPVALLAACASVPQRSNDLDAARAQVESLGNEPLAQEVAADDLKTARSRLQQGETALQDKRPMTEVDHYAYLARRSAEAGQARVQEAQARQQLAAAQSERNAILLKSRERETDIVKAQLAQTQQQLADLQAKKTDRGMVLTLGDVLFDTGQATIKPGATQVLDRLATFMAANSQTKVRIEGHTDSTGSPEFNQALSQRRADAVAAALENRGLSSERVSAIGRGQDFPVASNQTAAGRQQNRRVEIVFSDASGQFAGTG